MTKESELRSELESLGGQALERVAAADSDDDLESIRIEYLGRKDGLISGVLRRIEVRFPDPATNPYLGFTAMLMAGLDGVENKIDPGEPLDRDIYSLSAEELAGVPTMPSSLEAALEALEQDHEFLLKGDVFTQDAIQTWIDYKREAECKEVALRPHPHEFELYYDL